MVRLLSMLIAAAMVLPAAAGAQAVDVAKLDRRVGKIEAEMRAVQRKVFPGGDTRFFEPEVPAVTPVPVAAPSAAPASTPIADLTARVDALEGSLKGMTGQIEAIEYKLRQLEDGQRRLKGDVEFRLTALEGTKTAGDAVPADGTAAPTATVPAAKPATAPPPPAPANPAATPSAAKPATADTAWALAYPRVTARDWQGVETAMTKFVADWPKSPRTAQAKYWLGRSHAARSQHAQAAQAFLNVYQSAPRSAPAPDALIGLAGALTAMAKTDNACQVLDELNSVYGAKLTDTQKADAGRQRVRAKCPA